MACTLTRSSCAFGGVPFPDFPVSVDWARTSFVNTSTASSWAKMVMRDRFSRWKALFETDTSLPAKGCCVEKIGGLSGMTSHVQVPTNKIIHIM